MSLPPEMRNLIYDFTLLGEAIDVEGFPRNPALVQACRQVRHEAMPIWCCGNTFFITQNDYSCSIASWFCSWATEDALIRVNIDVPACDTTPDWLGLQHWLREHHADRALAPEQLDYPEDPDADDDVELQIKLLFIKARNLRGARWKHAKSALRDDRLSLIAKIPSWGK